MVVPNSKCAPARECAGGGCYICSVRVKVTSNFWPYDLCLLCRELIRENPCQILRTYHGSTSVKTCPLVDVLHATTGGEKHEYDKARKYEGGVEVSRGISDVTRFPVSPRGIPQSPQSALLPIVYEIEARSPLMKNNTFDRVTWYANVVGSGFESHRKYETPEGVRESLKQYEIG